MSHLHSLAWDFQTQLWGLERALNCEIWAGAGMFSLWRWQGLHGEKGRASRTSEAVPPFCSLPMVGPQASSYVLILA